ncbi:MAG TPA: RedB protein [Thermoanaerobaculia bacterium]|jgi:hypothetical protein|nr:RedB protein [Thermoanaerobaculia bacterium]
MNRATSLRIAILAAAMLWTATIAVAYREMRRFESTPGLPANAPRRFPPASALTRGAGQWTLVMLVHPHCSCSRASVQELAQIVEKAPHTMRTYVLVYRPRGVPAGWERSEVWAAAARLRGVQVVMDQDGREARRFGGFTSGQTFLFDGQGALRFAGGITSLRGHAGDNRGRQDVIRIASSGTGTASHPVFGCAISSAPTGQERAR